MVSAASSTNNDQITANSIQNMPVIHNTPVPETAFRSSQAPAAQIQQTAASMKAAAEKSRLKVIQHPETPPVDISPEEVWNSFATYPQQNDFEASVPVHYAQAPCMSINNVKAKAFKNGEIQLEGIALHANCMKPHIDQGMVVMAQAPHSPDSVWEHWHSIIEHTADVIEIVEPGTKSTCFDSRSVSFGLNFIHNSMLSEQMLSGHMPVIHIGPYQITEIHELEVPQHPKEAQLKERQFSLKVECKDTLDALEFIQESLPHLPQLQDITQNSLELVQSIVRKAKITEAEQAMQKACTIKYRLIETQYSNRLYTAESLDAMIKDQDHSKTRWITSQTGVARPAAFVVADALRQDILHHDIKNKHELHCKILTYVQRGRSIRGPKFIHSPEQLAELYRFGHMKLGLAISSPRLNPVEITRIDNTKVDIHEYPVRWIQYMDGRPHKPVGEARIFHPDVQHIYDFQTILGHLRSALWV